MYDGLHQPSRPWRVATKDGAELGSAQFSNELVLGQVPVRADGWVPLMPIRVHQRSASSLGAMRQGGLHLARANEYGQKVTFRRIYCDHRRRLALAGRRDANILLRHETRDVRPHTPVPVVALHLAMNGNQVVPAVAYEGTCGYSEQPAAIRIPLGHGSIGCGATEPLHLC